MAAEPRIRPAAAICGPISHAIVRLAKAHKAHARQLRQLLREVGCCARSACTRGRS